jgi:hypothetical protein
VDMGKIRIFADLPELRAFSGKNPMRIVSVFFFN